MASDAPMRIRPVRVMSSGGPPVGLPAGAPPLANDGREAELKVCCCERRRATGTVDRSEERRKAADMVL